MKKKILITGSAGFIGFHLVQRLLHDDFEIIGIDLINDYYDVDLKYKRLETQGIFVRTIPLKQIINSDLYTNYSFLKADVADYDFIVDFIVKEKFDYILHFAAQAGVRYSIQKPQAYTHSNIDGFLSILEGCRHGNVKHLIFASSSSVYGLNATMPQSENSSTEHPISLYAATKKANELMAHSYSHLFQVPTTGLRFFTVYGPWGRPDMALYSFAESILNYKPIKVFNHGKMIRDFTYIDDIAESVSRLIEKPASLNFEWDAFSPNSSTSSAPYQIFNIGNSNPIDIIEYIQALEEALNINAEKIFLEIQPGDVFSTYANTSRLENHINFKPKYNVKEGVKKFANWYLENIHHKK